MTGATIAMAMSMLHSIEALAAELAKLLSVFIRSRTGATGQRGTYIQQCTAHRSID
jgi:hypothetical protein